mgnify:CR=1 FL=1
MNNFAQVSLEQFIDQLTGMYDLVYCNYAGKRVDVYSDDEPVGFYNLDRKSGWFKKDRKEPYHG